MSERLKDEKSTVRGDCGGLSVYLCVFIFQQQISRIQNSDINTPNDDRQRACTYPIGAPLEQLGLSPIIRSNSLILTCPKRNEAGLLHGWECFFFRQLLRAPPPEVLLLVVADDTSDRAEDDSLRIDRVRLKTMERE